MAVMDESAYLISSICSRCLSRLQKPRRPHRILPSTTKLATRTFHSSPRFLQSPGASYPQKAITNLPSRAVVQISGSDAPKFLQGLTTQNIDPTSRDKSLYTGFLDARGRVCWDAILYPHQTNASLSDTAASSGDRRFLIEVDRSRRDAFIQHLRKHKLRSKIQIDPLDAEDITVCHAWPSSPNLRLDSALCSTAPDPRLPELGTRILVPRRNLDAVRATAAAQGWPAADPQAYAVHRTLHGVPEGARELVPGAALPQESNMDFLHGVDFRKGCYVGQELTIRTQHTGVVRKRILPVMLYAGRDGTPPPPAALEYRPGELELPQPPPDDNGEGSAPPQFDIRPRAGSKRSAGRLLSSVGNVGLALCRLEMMTDLRVSAEGGTYQPGSEFVLVPPEGVGLEEEIRVKPFVPDWMRSRLREEWERKKERMERE